MKNYNKILFTNFSICYLKHMVHDIEYFKNVYIINQIFLFRTPHTTLTLERNANYRKVFP